MARRLLGLLLFAMALGQASNIGGFIDILSTHRIGGTTVAAMVAVALLTGEVAGGIGLLAGGATRRRRGAVVAVAVAVAWSVLAAQAFARGLDIENCGCFGVHLGQPLRWWVLLEDAEFVALALWVWHTTRLATTGPAPVTVDA